MRSLLEAPAAPRLAGRREDRRLTGEMTEARLTFCPAARHQRSWRSSTVEQLTCNEQVGGSIPFASSSFEILADSGYPAPVSRYYGSRFLWAGGRAVKGDRL